MKKTVRFSIIACLAVLLFACKDEERKTEEPYFSVETGFLTQTFGTEADTKYVTVNTNQTFMATSSASWCTTELLEGETVEQLKISVEQLNAVTPRTATVTVACQGFASVSIAVTQTGVAPTLSVEPLRPDTVSGEGGDVTFAVTSNVDEWNYSIAEGAGWLSEKAKTATTLTLTAAASSETASRNAAVRIFLTAYPDVSEDITVIQAAAFEPRLNVTPPANSIVARTGGTLTFDISANTGWEYSIDNSWLSATQTAAGLTVTAANNQLWSGRNAVVTVSLSSYPEYTRSFTVGQSGAADMLDVIFSADGAAFDVSPMAHTVNWIDFDFPLSVAYSAAYGRNAVTFNPASNGGSPGANHGSYYRIDYGSNEDFKNKLADGHSFECLVKFDVDYVTATQNYETKFFSTHEGGGTGFLIANQNQGSGPNGITFLPNIPAANGGGSTWIWANSQIKPDGRKYYHLVGVWNQTEGKAYIYVDGELKKETAAAGFYRPPSSDACLWVAIGGDASNNSFQNGFKGSIVTARIYDSPLTASDALALYSEIKTE
jgi:hypothetical protein